MARRTNRAVRASVRRQGRWAGRPRRHAECCCSDGSRNKVLSRYAPSSADGGIPVQLASEEFTGVWRRRETRALINWLNQREGDLVTGADLNGWVNSQPDGPWVELIRKGSTSTSWQPAAPRRTWTLRRLAGRVGPRGATPTTGTAPAHPPPRQRAGVRSRGRAGRRLEPRWPGRGCRCPSPALPRGHDPRTADADPDAPAGSKSLPGCIAGCSRSAAARRAGGYAVASTRGLPPVPAAQPAGRVPGFSGYRDPAHPVHQAIAGLNPGDSLQVRNDDDRWELLDGSGMMVGQLARSFSAPSGSRRVHASVLAVVPWDRESSEPEYRQGLRSDAWEVVAPELVFEPER